MWSACSLLIQQAICMQNIQYDLANSVAELAGSAFAVRRNGGI